MSGKDIEQRLLDIYGIDLSFDARPGVQGSKDVVANGAGDDFAYVPGPGALAQELQRLFDLTPVGSFIDDPTYGIDWSLIGTAIEPRVATALAKLAIVRALSHPSFEGRCRLTWVDVWWQPSEPNALRCVGVLQCFGFEGIEYVRFGPYVGQYWLRSRGE